MRWLHVLAATTRATEMNPAFKTNDDGGRLPGNSGPFTATLTKQGGPHWPALFIARFVQRPYSTAAFLLSNTR